MYILNTVFSAWLSFFKNYHSAAFYIKDERSRKPCYSFKDYLKALTEEGAQDRIEQALLKRGQDPYQHTRKQAISMAAKQMVSNNPNMYKVSFIRI